MTFGSVCSGIEAASVAWEPLGWKAAWFSEIEPYACALLSHRYSGVPNLGDMRRLRENETVLNAPIDLLVGGTPCQSFSQAGRRRGLGDPRGDLALDYLKLVGIARPRWFVWENVVGVLSSRSKKSGDSAFGVFLQAIQDLGYGFAWRVLDAQYFGVPQKRRRVYVVAHAGGDWRPPFAALFERESLLGEVAPVRKKKVELEPDAIRERLNAGAVFGVDVYNFAFTGDIAATLTANSHAANAAGPKILDSAGIRTLTPNECERLQGFPDGYTGIPGKWRESHRIKALGNSMAVPVMRWLGVRISMVSDLPRSLPAASGGASSGPAQRIGGGCAEGGVACELQPPCGTESGTA